MTMSVNKLQQLVAKRATQMTAMRAFLEKAGDAALSAEQETEYSAMETTLSGINASIKREQDLQEQERTAPAAADLNAPPANAAIPGIRAGHDRAADKPFVSLGEQLQAVAKAQTPGGETDIRLFGAATGGSAAIGGDGGFTVQKDFSTTLMQESFETGVLASRCSSQEISANSDGLEVPVLKDKSRATGSRWGGVRVYRRAEAETVTPSNAQMGTWSLRLYDLMALSFATQRLLDDAPALQGVTSAAVTKEFAFRLDDEILHGTGVGQYLGILKSGALVKVPKETGQAAASVVSENVLNMWARMPVRNRASSAWYINQELEPQLPKMTLGAAEYPIYLPPGGLSGGMYSTLFGRPVLPIEQCPVPGEVGDICLLDLADYQVINKGATRQDTSMHVRFLYDEMAFRWIMRTNGAPRSEEPITPYKGSKPLSPFVTLDARS
jgi:HK97 family phage major capsid protein